MEDRMAGGLQGLHLVLDPAGEKVNILEYLKTEMLEERRVDKGAGSVVSLFDRDVSLKIEVLEDGTARAVPEAVLGKARAEVQEEVGGKEKEGLRVGRPKNYVCDDCGTAFVSTKDLARHSVVHTGEKPYSCPYCDQKFTAPSSRATHIRSIHEKSQVKHYKTIHLETVVIICQECGRDFNQASALRRHIKIVHKKELPHGCSQCGKRFALAESLKKHMEAIHLKSRAYPCTYCDYAASRADMLKIHIRKIHTKEWSYKCSICAAKGTPWGCILPKELRRHQQARHPGEPGEQGRHQRRPRRSVKSEEQKSVEDEEEVVGNVEERAAELLEQIRHPLEFSVQLEAEVRAAACRAPRSVLAGARQEERSLVFAEEVLLAPEQGWEYGPLYRGEGWAEGEQGGHTVVVQGARGDTTLRLLYDFPR